MSPTNVKADVDFSNGTGYKNIEILYENVKGMHWQKAQVLAILMHSLCLDHQQQHLRVRIHHNVNYQYYDSATYWSKAPYKIAVGYESRYKEKYPFKKAAPTLFIYYFGPFDVEKHLKILDYALTHLEEIKQKQRYIMTLYRWSDTLHLAVPEPELNISYKNTPAIEKALQKKVYISWFGEEFREIDYFYSEGKYHIIKRDVPKENINRFNRVTRVVAGSELLALDDIYEVLRFTNQDYLIFDRHNRFYYINNETSKVSGPYFTLGISGNIDDHYILNRMLVIKLRHCLNYECDNVATIKFDTKRYNVSSDELKTFIFTQSRLNLLPYSKPPEQYKKSNSTLL